ncbi:MAG TPA: SUMF1/EgtB/PvdO family nonheme iron enzyme, partial [Planctomycetota bacterium]|nr:SUMF1/EgtB/PvdO family nonheme iron enzyme [Planctomycetota bacterium]
PLLRNAATLYVTRWAVGCCGFLAACAPEQATTPPRSGQFGSLRDFVLFERPDDREPAFFLDRFEVTRADWGEFAASNAGRAVEADPAIARGDGSLPVARVDLRQARAFAAWRFSRLPRHDEWMFAAVGDGRHPYPWGHKDDRTRANTAELGLGESTPVGTFESGRRPGSDQPYDLVGNVSEWTETVPPAWWEGYPIHQESRSSNQLDPLASVSMLREQVLRTPALAVWQEAGGLVPLSCLVEAGGDQVPREVVGADFSTKMAFKVEAVLSGDRRDRTGFRLCATPRTLLRALVLQSHDVKEQDLEQLRRFVLRGRHRAVLGPAWPSVVEELGSVDDKSPVVRTLGELLATQDATNGGR